MASDKNLKDSIRKYALQNALKFEGKASHSGVIGKIMGEFPDARSNPKETQKLIDEIVNAVNKLSFAEQKCELEKIAPELLIEKKPEKKKVLSELKDTTTGVIMRFEPSPSGPLHIGHSYVLSLNSEYCKKYGGKLILRISDTNPNNIFVPAYEMIQKDADWITGDNVGQFVIQSERLEIYYSYMEKLLALGKAYICTCDPARYKERVAEKVACPCRDLPISEQKTRWKNMFGTYKKGEAVARVKTDVSHPNPAMRDWPAFRINETNHPRVGKKYRVWPLMNMAVVVDDIELGVTHIIRAKEHADNAKRQEYVYNYLGKKIPQTLFVGKIQFEDMRVSCSKTRPFIESGKYSGWDDIRLPFLAALKRRGYQPGAFVRYALDVGISLNDKKVTKDEFFKNIDAHNRDIVEPVADRYFFIANPKFVKITGAPEQQIVLDLHPDHKKGGRIFATNTDFYLSPIDFEKLKNGQLYRLMDCLNFVKLGDELAFDSLGYETYRENGALIMHWLSALDKNVPVEVVMPDAQIVSGIGESAIRKLKPGAIVQFERFGFVRLDAIEGLKYIFWYLHR